jgi:hypothetical protein
MTIVVMLSRANYTPHDFYLKQPLIQLKKWIDVTNKVNKIMQDKQNG